MVFLHELGHILFTPDDLGDEALLDFTRVASHNSPELLTAEFYWLDNVFTDGRLRGSISREFPDHTKAILEDGRLAVELQAGICYALSGVETPADLTSSQAFGRLEPREQVGLLMMARLNGTPDLEQPWLEAADQSVQECFSQLRPLLEATRHGQDQEYLTAQAPCFQILNESDLVPSLAVKDYHVIGAGVEHDTFVGYFTKMLVELDRPISARPASLGLDAEQLSTRLLEAKRVLLNTEKRVQLAAEVQRPVQPALAL
jgi:hypothetical protein